MLGAPWQEREHANVDITIGVKSECIKSSAPQVCEPISEQGVNSLIWTTSHIQNHVHQCWYLNLPNFLYSLIIWKLYISELLSQEYLKPDSILYNVVKVILGNTQPVIWILVIQCAQHIIVSSSENSQASLEYRGAIFITLTYCITLYIIVEWLHTKIWTLYPGKCCAYLQTCWSGVQ